MKTILFTGSSGFMGKEIIPKLTKYNIITVGLENSNIIANIAGYIPELPQVDIVIHAAAKVHEIALNINDEKEFFDVNLQGTKNLCFALEKNAIPKSFIYISSVAVYGIDIGKDINEEHQLNGDTPYALSKIQAEEFLKNWCQRNNVKLGILRPSLIAGKNPLGNLGAMINGIKTGKYLRIGKGSAQKSVLMAEDIARIIPRLAEVGGIYNVCDNHHPSFSELEELISKQLNKKSPHSIPYWVAKSLALVGDLMANKFPINSNKFDKITQSLTFSNEKAKCKLDWEPLDVLNNFKIE